MVNQSLSQRGFGWEAEYALDWSLANCKAHEDQQAITLTFTPTNKLKSFINQACVWALNHYYHDCLVACQIDLQLSPCQPRERRVQGYLNVTEQRRWVRTQIATPPWSASEGVRVRRLRFYLETIPARQQINLGWPNTYGAGWTGKLTSYNVFRNQQLTDNIDGGVTLICFSICETHQRLILLCLSHCCFKGILYIIYILYI